MTLGRRSLFLVLIALYIGAVWARFASVGGLDYPYYKGESGTNFRAFHEIVDSGALPQSDVQASWPEGYSPSLAKPNGVEFVTAFAYRLVRPFSDVAEKDFSSVFTVLFFSLSVFTLFVLTRRLWSCQAAGVFAALLVALSAPLVGATNGKEFIHAPYAFVVITLHLAIFLSYVARPSVSRAVLSGLAAFVLFSAWEGASLYTAAFGLVVLVLPVLSPQLRRRVLAATLAATLAAGLVLPHLRAARLVLSWPTIWLAVITVVSFCREKLPRKIPVWVYVAGAFAVLTLALKPFQSGGTGVLDPLSYWYYRIRFIAGKPADPTFLPDAVRLAWDYGHIPPEAAGLAVFFLPLVLLLPFAVVGIRALKREKNVVVWVPLAAAAVGIAVYLVDRRAVFSAALFAFPLVSGAFRDFRSHSKARAVPAILAVALLAGTSPLVTARVDAVRRVNVRLGLLSAPTDGFVWASIGNADRDLVRFLTTRTSTRSDVVLAPPDISSLIATFAGRSTALVPGVFSRDMTRKVIGALPGFYGDETGLYTRCESLGATYVLYSIDILLDGSRYSPRYAAGVAGDIEKTLAYKLHFAPETLRRFQLVHENDAYRLFRVTADVKPVFLTDHPPVYQEAILREHKDDFGRFYSRIIDILSTYQTGVSAQARGDERGAIPRFLYCLDQAPAFTAARLGVGDSLLRLGKTNDAFNVYSSVLQYAPDNTHALYFGALSLAYLGRREEAGRIVDLLLTATAQRDIHAQALELKAALESGRRIEMPRKAAQEDAK